MMFKKIFLIAHYTFFEILKSKILINVMMLGFALLLLCFIAYSFAYGVPERVALDLGLAAINLSSVAIALFMGVTLISKEIEAKTIYMILSRPVKRDQFILGRVLGMMLFLLLNNTLLSIMTIGLFLILGGVWQTSILLPLFFSYMESLIVLLLVMAFSLVTNIGLSVLYTFGLYFFGHMISSIEGSHFVRNIPLFEKALVLYQFIFPNFSKLNYKDIILYQMTIPNIQILKSLSYSFFYSSFLMIVILLLFRKKSLD